MTTALPRPRPLPGSLGIGWRRGVGEVRAFARNRGALVFNVALPMALMLLFGNLFQGDANGIPIHDVVVSGVVASSVMSSAFGGMAYGISLDLSDGTLRRLWATPFTMTAYFIAKIILVLALAVFQVAAVFAVAALAFGFALPSDPGRWLTFGWVFVLGIASTALLGVLVGALVRDGRNAGGLVQFPFVLLQFISGTYYVFSGLPPVLQHIGALFPLKWITQGIQSALLPDAFVAATPAGSWEHPMTAAVLVAWTVGSGVLGAFLLRRRLRRQFS